MKDRVVAHLKRGFGLWFSADLRSLALVRICMGLLCIWDIARRFEWIEVFYSNVGVLPNHFNLYRPFSAYNISVMNALNTPGEVAVFFWLGIIAAFLFTIGYRTKLFHVITAVVIISIHSRNVMLENGGDVVLNLWLMWSVFLPLGARYSVDALRSGMRRIQDRTPAALNQDHPPERTRVWHLAVFAILMQLVVIYFFNTVHKDGPNWYDGTALAWTLQQDRIVTPIGMWVRDLPLWVTQFMTWSTLVIEGTAPLLILSPIFSTWCRRIVVFNLCALHIGIYLMTDVGLFSFDMMCMFPILLTAPDFALARRWLRRLAGEPVTVFYDSDCGVCHWSARVVRRMDLLGLITWVGRDPDAARPPGWAAERFEERRDQTILVWGQTSDRVEEEHSAILRILDKLPLLRLVTWIGRVPGISHLLGAGYRAFAARRHSVSAAVGLGVCGVDGPGQDSAPAPTPPARIWARRTGAVVGSLVVAFMMAATGSQLLVENRWLRKRIKHKQPTWARAAVVYGRWFQGWGMFAPHPPKTDGALVIDAVLEDGTHVDPQTGKPPVFAPADATRMEWNQFWGSYSMRIASGRRKANRPALRDWLKNQNIRHLKLGKDQKIKGFTVWWIGDRSPDPRKGGPPVETERYKITSWRMRGEE